MTGAAFCPPAQHRFCDAEYTAFCLCNTITERLQIADFCEEIVISSLRIAINAQGSARPFEQPARPPAERLKVVHLDASAGLPA
jgi:hypothetical protein